jgi:hypothetical protein
MCNRNTCTYKQFDFETTFFQSFLLYLEKFLLDIHVSVHHDIIYENDQQDATV